MKLLPPFDLQGLIVGVLLCSMGLLFLNGAGLVTGQTAGVALLLSYVLPLGFGPLFFLIGVPFLIPAFKQRGAVFAFRTVLALVGISVGSYLLPAVVSFQHIHPGIAAMLGGAATGVGLIAIFRHNASAGGLSILSILVEHRTGLKAGWFQLMVDAAVFGASAFVLSGEQWVYSVLGALITNSVVAWNFEVSQSGAGKPNVVNFVQDEVMDEAA